MSHAETMLCLWRASSMRGDRGLVAGRVLAGVLLLSAAAAAQQEVPVAREFSLIKRYEGSRLIGLQFYGIARGLEHAREREFYMFGTKIELFINRSDPHYATLEKSM
jgi:hypothetical protein